MTLAVSDLTSEQKKQLLAYAQSQLGEQTFHNVVDRFGEDQLLENLLTQGQKQTAGPSQSAASLGSQLWEATKALFNLFILLYVAYEVIKLIIWLVKKLL